MPRIILKGWKVGMRGIPFTFLLKEKLGLSLTASNDIKLRVLNGETIILDIVDYTTGRSFIQEATALGVICEFEN